VFPLDQKYMIIIGGSKSTKFPEPEFSDKAENIYLVDIPSNEVVFSKKIKSFRMFSACGRGVKDSIYMIGGRDPKNGNWKSDASFIESLTFEMKNQA